jgi:hypothetical protein
MRGENGLRRIASCLRHGEAGQVTPREVASTESRSFGVKNREMPENINVITRTVWPRETTYFSVLTRNVSLRETPESFFLSCNTCGPSSPQSCPFVISSAGETTPRTGLDRPKVATKFARKHKTPREISAFAPNSNWQMLAERRKAPREGPFSYSFSEIRARDSHTTSSQLILCKELTPFADVEAAYYASLVRVFLAVREEPCSNSRASAFW